MLPTLESSAFVFGIALVPRYCWKLMNLHATEIETYIVLRSTDVCKVRKISS